MLETLFGSDLSTGIFIVLNLIVLESLLSIDNAAVLASMVMDLPPHQRNKALRYGIIGAYVFRGLCLIFAAWLVKILWLKILGGLYLCWLTYDYFKKKAAGESDEEKIDKEGNFIFRKLKGWLGIFWTTVVLVEIMDLSFSIDNIFACVAFTDKIGLICFGVFVGILAMRFVAQGFVKLLERYPLLEKMAFNVIGLLGIKLVLSGICDYLPGNPITPILNHHLTDIFFSVGILVLFLLPIILKKPEYAKNS